MLLLYLVDQSIAPQLHFVERFQHISRDQITFIRGMNRYYREYVGRGYQVNIDDRTIAIIEKECDLLWSAWDALEDAMNVSYAVDRRRRCLGKVLVIIGPEMFLAGRMPPPVPFWRFTQVRNVWDCTNPLP